MAKEKVKGLLLTKTDSLIMAVGTTIQMDREFIKANNLIESMKEPGRMDIQMEKVFKHMKMVHLTVDSF
jgi:hypothetical protein